MAISNSTDRFNGYVASLAVKVPCVAAATSNITLSGEQTISGIAVVADDRVLVAGQTNAVENGIYLVKSSAWERAPDFDGTRDATENSLVLVARDGQDPVFYKVDTAEPFVIGTTALSFSVLSFGGSGDVAAGAGALADRVAFWSDATTITGDAGLTYTTGASGVLSSASEIKTTEGTFGGEAATVIGRWFETGLAADSGMWTIEADGGALYVARARADDGTGGGAVFRANRSGTSVTSTLWFTDINLNDNTLSKAVLTEYYLTNNASTPTGTTAALAFGSGNAVELDLGSSTGNVTATLSNIDSGRYAEMIVKVKQHATTPRTVTWEHFGGTFLWPGGSPPVVSVGANAIDIFKFKTWDGGTTIYGDALQNYS